jgi:hypothetical protein
MRHISKRWVSSAFVLAALSGCEEPIDELSNSAESELSRCRRKATVCTGAKDAGATTDDAAAIQDGGAQETPTPVIADASGSGGGSGPSVDPGPPSAILTVGPGKTYATPCAAIAAAPANAEIDIDAATYTDSCEIATVGLRLRGVGGRPKIDLSGTNHPFGYKGIYVVSADNVFLDNLELTGAHIDDSNGANGAGLRVTGHGLVVHNCFFHDNQNGILGGPLDDAGTLTIEYSEFARNGQGNGCNTGGCTHNVYLGRWDKVLFRFNWTHDLANDTPDKGHLLKSRAKETQVLYNRITGEQGPDSYEIEMPNGGVGIVIGNVIQKGPNAGNPTLLSFGAEGLQSGASTLSVVGNTFVNDRSSGTFISVHGGAPLVAHDNIFAGPGTPSSTGALSGDNLSGVDPLFVDKASHDYHLTAGSPARGKGVDPGSVGTFSLRPAYEYVHPMASSVRSEIANLGAFE